MTNDQENTIIVLRLPRAEKGAYVAASRAAGVTLAQWIRSTLTAASEPTAGRATPDGPQPGAPRRDPGRSAGGRCAR